MEVSEEDRNRINWWSNISVIIGFLISLSLITLASFRVNEMIKLHSFGTLPYFLCGPFLYIIQTWISFRLQPHVNSRFVSFIRLIISVIAVLSVILFYAFTFWSFYLFSKDWQKDRPKWTDQDDGYWQHVVAAAAQWVYILSATPFFITFVTEYRRLILLRTAVFIYKLEGSSQPSYQISTEWSDNSVIL